MSKRLNNENAYAILEAGETYRFAGYSWTACELVNDGRVAVIQSHGVTHGAWPGFVMSQFGNGNYYSKSIDGDDISAYDDKMQALYDAIKDVEDTSASYGKGLYLIPKEKAGFTEYIAVCDEVENRLADDSGDAKYRACEHVLGEGFDKTETWIIKSMFTANHESRTVEHPETFSSEQEAWNKVKSLVLADQDGNEITEVKYDRDACQVTMIHANKTVCWISAEKK